MKRHTLVLAVVLIFGMAVAPTVALAAEDPRITTDVPEPTVTPGQTTQLTVQFTNDAEDLNDQVKTATDVKATMMTGDTPITVLSGQHRLAPMPDGQIITGQFAIRVPQNVDPGTYHLPIRLHYVHDGDEEETITVHATVKIEDRAMFSVVDTSEDLTVGESGSVTLTLENNGTENVTDSTVTLQSQTRNVVFGSSASTVAYVGEWQPGETREITVDASSPPSADAGTYSIAATVAYQNSEGFDRQWPPMNVGVHVEPETDQFSLSNVEHTLRVGEKGHLNMTVTNDGEAVTEAVVRVSSVGTNIHPLANEYAIGDMQSGDSVAVSFPIEISQSAEATPRQFAFTVAYENGDGDQRASDPLKVSTNIRPEQDQFTVDPVSAAVAVGSGGQITVKVTNNGETTVSDIDAKMFTNDPLSSSDDQAYIESLDPGQSANIRLSVAAGGSATVKTYPVSLDFQYDSDGDSKLSKTYRVPVSVTEPDNSGPSPFLIGGAIVVVVGIIAIVLYRRR